jgi:hypothetical protein
MRLRQKRDGEFPQLPGVNYAAIINTLPQVSTENSEFLVKSTVKFKKVKEILRGAGG